MLVLISTLHWRPPLYVLLTLLIFLKLKNLAYSTLKSNGRWSDKYYTGVKANTFLMVFTLEQEQIAKPVVWLRFSLQELIFKGSISDLPAWT